MVRHKISVANQTRISPRKKRTRARPQRIMIIIDNKRPRGRGARVMTNAVFIGEVHFEVAFRGR